MCECKHDRENGWISVRKDFAQVVVGCHRKSAERKELDLPGGEDLLLRHKLLHNQEFLNEVAKLKWTTPEQVVQLEFKKHDKTALL